MTRVISLRYAIRLASRFVWVAVVFAQAVQPMPRIEGESFAEQKVVLPDSAQGKVAVLVFGFTKASKQPTSAWADKIYSDFGARSGFELYQLPVLESVPRFIRGMVISSMKKGVPEKMRAHFVPILQNESELRTLVGYKETDDAYLVVLDATGHVVAQKHGPFSDFAYAQFRTDVEFLLEHSK
jgi:hypothetical protein